MPIKYEDGVVKVSFSYGLKLNRGDYQSEDAHSSVSFELPIEGEPTEILSELVELETQIATHVKLDVFTQLGIEGFNEIAEGVVGPKLGSAPKSAPSKPATSGGSKRSYGGGGGGKQGGGQFSPPKADVSELDVVAIAGAAYYDQRPLKASGTYKPGAADFRSVKDRSDQLWILNRDGSYNDETVALLDEAGVEYE